VIRSASNELLSFGARVKGSSHQRMGKVCQDALGWGKYRDTVLVAVADGHGSPACKYSDIGARKGVSSFFDVMLNLAKQFQNNQEEFHAFVSRNRNDVIPQNMWRMAKKQESFIRNLIEKKSFLPFITVPLCWV